MARNILIERYHEKVKNEFPQLSEAEFHEIINFTFRYFRRRMSENDLPDVRLKGFGSFQIFATPVLTALTKHRRLLEKKLQRNPDLPENCDTFLNIKMLENYVEKNPKLFEKANKRRNELE